MTAKCPFLTISVPFMCSSLMGDAEDEGSQSREPWAPDEPYWQLSHSTPKATSAMCGTLRDRAQSSQLTWSPRTRIWFYRPCSCLTQLYLYQGCRCVEVTSAFKTQKLEMTRICSFHPELTAFIKHWMGPHVLLMVIGSDVASHHQLNVSSHQLQGCLGHPRNVAQGPSWLFVGFYVL